MSAPHLLFLAHRIPYPPDKGDKIRSYHLLRHLAQSYRVHLAAFVDDPADWQHRAVLEGLCASVTLVALHRRRALLRSLGGLLRGEALSVPFYRDAAMRRAVAGVTATYPVSAIVVFSSAVAQYAEDDNCRHCLRILDFVDVDSDKWRQYAARKRWPASLVYRRESRRLLDYERRMAATFDHAFFVSPEEAALFRELAPEAAARVGHFNNGVDFNYFSPDHVAPNPFGGDGPHLVFTGAMDYWANVDAVTWFAREVLGGIRTAFPQATFWIVGSRPAAEVAALTAIPGVKVTGRVPDVRPYLRNADVVVAPMRVARGVQNKVLEALAMGCAVVATPAALEGLSAGHDLDSVPEEPAAFASATCAAIRRVQACQHDRNAPRTYIKDSYSWQASLAPLDRVLPGTGAAAGHDERAREATPA